MLFCPVCLLQSNVENVSPHIIRLVTKEVSDLQKSPPEGIKIIANDEDITDVQAYIDGPGIYHTNKNNVLKQLNIFNG